MAPQLLDLAPEIKHFIFGWVGPRDLGRLCKCNRRLNQDIQNDGLLWKNQFLSNFDSPLAIGDEPDWKSRLQRYVLVERILQSADRDVKRSNNELVISTALEMIENSSPIPLLHDNIALLAPYFDDPINRSEFMCCSSLFKEAGRSTDAGRSIAAEEKMVTDAQKRLRQLSAKLSVFYGPSLEPTQEMIDTEHAKAIHPYARARIYDLRRYKKDLNFWGPFLDDGSQRPDWEKLQALMTVLSYNLRVLSNRTSGALGGHWDNACVGLTANSYQSELLSHNPKMERPALDAEDPYGVSGTWMRIVCFLDYVNLYSFNFEGDQTLPLDRDRPPNHDTEAIRMIILKLRVTEIEDAGEDEKPGTKIVHFKGTSRSMHMSFDPNANSRVRGTVRTTPSGAIRWTSYSIYHGEERWRSEAVQIGGIRSARGCMGTWFDKDFDPHGPAGPTAFWKRSDDIDVEAPHPTHVIYHVQGTFS